MHVLTSECRWLMDGQGLERFSPSLPESSSEPILSSATIVFCPVVPPRVGPQGQRCARVGPVTPLVVECHLYPKYFVSFHPKSMRLCRTPRECFEVILPFPEPREAFFLKGLNTTENFCRVQNSLRNQL